MDSIQDECLRLALQILAHDDIKKHEIMLNVVFMNQSKVTLGFRLQG